MAATSKAEYLKKYLSENAEEKKKRKKRKVPSSSAKVNRSRLVDDDIDLKSLLPENLDKTLEDYTEDNDPTVAEFIDERPEHVKQLERFRTSGAWKVMGKTEDSNEGSSPVRRTRHDSGSDESPPRRRKYDSDSDQTPPRRKRHDSDSDQSPLRKKRHDSDSDQSPPRKKLGSNLKSIDKKHTQVPKSNKERKKSRFSDLEPGDRYSSKQSTHSDRHNNQIRTRQDSDSDNSPSRRKRHNPDQSPPRRKRYDSDSDQSPPKRKRHDSDSDQSPPRRKRHDSDSDQSPPRRKRHTLDSDQSPLRRKRHDSDSDQSPPRKKRYDSDSDQSPPRRRKNNTESSQSFQRRKRHDSDSDQSPARKKSGNYDNRSNSSSGRRRPDSDSDLSPPRRSHYKSVSNEREKKTLGGKKAGLSSAKEMRKETQELRRKEEEKFSQISDEHLGKGAATVFRDRKSGRKRDLEDERRQEAEENQRKAKENEKYQQWGKGLKQSQQQNQKVEEALHEVNKPLARYKDDEDLDKMLREMDRAEDPMLAFIKKKKKTNEDPKKEKPRYRGPAPPPNRFGIAPGYRWDGVDRSNGFEKKLFAAQSESRAKASAAYKWSVEDM